MYIVASKRLISFHDDFYCMGFDAEKVKNGIEDLRLMSEVEPEKNWNSGLVVCCKIYYSKIGKTRQEMETYNNEVMLIQVI